MTKRRTSWRSLSLLRHFSLLARVLRLRLLVPDLCDSVVRGHRGLAQRDRDQRDLALVARDVTGGVDTGLGAAHRGGIDLELAAAEVLQTPMRDRAEVRGKAEQRDQRIAGHPLGIAAGRVLDRYRLDPVVAVDLAHLAGRHDPRLALALERSCLRQRRFQRTEAVTPVNEHDRRLGNRSETEQPIERRVAATHDHAALLGKLGLLAYGVEQASSLPVVDAVERELAR